MKALSYLFLFVTILSCTNITKTAPIEPTKSIVWVSSINKPCDSKANTFCMQIQNNANPKIGQWVTWQDSIVGFKPEIGYTYKLNIVSSNIKRKESHLYKENTKLTLVDVIEKKRDPGFILYNLWGLYSINKTILNTSKQRPRLELNLTSNTFMGHAFCNDISGTVHTLNDRIQFSNITQTEMACKHLEDEVTFLNILKKPLTFKSLKNQIALFDSQNNEVLRFKKLD